MVLPDSSSNVGQTVNYCTIRRTVDAIAGKWKLLIIAYLLGGGKRYSELRALIPEATENTLSRELRALEADGIVTRTVLPQVPPRVDYALTAYGMEVKPILFGLKEWGEKMGPAAAQPG
ncbi:winged helix-turn-helix transcriptional regulator [Hymenobacter terrenus]|uniref:winged helix-turn-helix transcriptional regulator n=1 Tax=Hymenobacter terrenus TaxID=1629124 RepID=UPI0018CFB4F7|nr:helix-turn-helix domain-containing protein [Hymenobacter terrenus]